MRSYEWKLALSLSLLFMILMRLVWMDLRSYPPYYPPQNRLVSSQNLRADPCLRSFELRQKQALVRSEEVWPRPSWGESVVYRALVHGSCRLQNFDEQVFIRYNQGFLISLVFAAALLTRFLCRSWIMALMIAVSLLSRGRLISMNGTISPDLAMGALLLFWAAGLGHFLRSGAAILLLIVQGFALVLASLEPSFLVLFALPAGLILLGQKRPLYLFRGETEMRIVSKPGHLLRPAAGGLRRQLEDSTFARRLLKVALVSAGFGFLLWEGLYGLRGIFEIPHPPHWSRVHYQHWFQLFSQPLDRDLLLAMGLTLLTAVVGAGNFPGLSALCLLAFMGCLGTFGMSALLDRLYLPGVGVRQSLGPDTLLIWEGVFLTLGILCFFAFIFQVFQIFWRWKQRSRQEEVY